MARPKKSSTPDRQPALPLNDPTTRLLLQLRVGDVVLDQAGAEWEVCHVLSGS
jgi:hypothetical protein